MSYFYPRFAKTLKNIFKGLMKGKKITMKSHNEV